MTVGEKIKARRIELHMSQEELAKKCGYKSRSSINKIEISRDLPLSKVKKMANALDLSVSYLMDWEESEETERDLPDFDFMISKEEDFILGEFRKLDDEQKNQLVDYLAFLKMKNNTK